MPQPAAAEDFVKLFTDGACSGNPGPGGWAFILEHPATGRRLEKSGAELHATNNRMEIISALRGLANLKRPCRVELVTDSLYLAKGISEWLPGWKANNFQRKEGRKLKPLSNEDLWREMDSHLAIHEIKVVHVRGHRGHPENERCDEMAVNAYKQLMAEQRSQPAPQETPSIKPPSVAPSPSALPEAVAQPTIQPIIEKTVPTSKPVSAEPSESRQSQTHSAIINQQPLIDSSTLDEPVAPVSPLKKAARSVKTTRPKVSSTSKSATTDRTQPDPLSDQSSPAPATSKAVSDKPAPKTARKPAAPKRSRKSPPKAEVHEDDMPLRWDPDDM